MDNDIKRKFESWLCTDDKAMSIAEQAVCLRNEPERQNGVTNMGGKHSKRASEKVKERHHFRIDKEEVVFQRTKMDTMELTSKKKK